MLQVNKPLSYPIGRYELTIFTEDIPFGKTLTNEVHSFLLRTPKELYLFDTGRDSLLAERIKRIGIHPKEIHKIYMTHMHPNHMGGLMRLGVPAFSNAQLVVPQAEYTYWTNKELEKLASPQLCETFVLTQNIFTQYQKRLELILPTGIHEPFSDGVQPVEAYGHTVGHTAYLISSEDEQFIIGGDLVASPETQMIYPDSLSSYDMNGEKAMRTRRRILKYATQQKALFTGSHFPYPYIGKVIENPDTQGYQFIPLSFKP